MSVQPLTSVNHFLDLTDVPSEILHGMIQNAHKMKNSKFTPAQIFSGLSLAMVFDKRSTRTRMSFEVAMKQLGGHTIPMNMSEIQLTGAENIEDTAQVLSRYVDAVMIRMSDHDTLVQLAKHSSIPVINGLTDWSHPCQIMADIMTIEEKLGDIKGKTVAWFGDYNNVTRSFGHAAEIFGFDLVLGLPEELHSKVDVSAKLVTADAAAAAKNADVIVTDTWESMGQEGKSLDMFRPYQVNSALMANAADHAIFMHCMPIHREDEVTNVVLASKQCVIYDEAENRLHAQKAILAWCLANAGVQIQQKFDFAA
ncbi:MAG: ornithine carbamoyltransferase [Pseudomonadota bacterium]|nr:ornithine carbamoyltransferase [Pseudomonadota bacterium]